MALSIYKKGQGSVARFVAGSAAIVFSYFLGAEVHLVLTKFMGLPDGVGIGLGVVACAASAVWLAHYVLWNPRTVDYLIETELEMRKVNWPTKKEVIASTGVVIACVIVLGVYIFFNDLLIGFGLKALKIF
jgi:preprotein translocase subunit SecE